MWHRRCGEAWSSRWRQLPYRRRICLHRLNGHLREGHQLKCSGRRICTSSRWRHIAIRGGSASGRVTDSGSRILLLKLVAGLGRRLLADIPQRRRSRRQLRCDARHRWSQVVSLRKLWLSLREAGSLRHHHKLLLLLLLHWRLHWTGGRTHDSRIWRRL